MFLHFTKIDTARLFRKRYKNKVLTHSSFVFYNFGFCILQKWPLSLAAMTESPVQRPVAAWGNVWKTVTHDVQHL